MVMLREIAEAEEKREDLEEAYLRERGWQQTCETPGSLWVWTKIYPMAGSSWLAEPRHSPCISPGADASGGRATGKSGPADARTRR
jgi:hypothetical protein